MKVKVSVMMIPFILLVGCYQPKKPKFFSHESAVNKVINKVEQFPSIPEKYQYFDYRNMAKELDRVVFSFAQNPEAVPLQYLSNDPSSWNPIGYWIDQPRQPADYNPLITGYLKRSFGLPTYIGDNRVLSSGSEALTTLAMVLGSSWAGINKSEQLMGNAKYNFVEMTLASYDTGSKLVHNNGIQGQSFWYDIFPQILFARLYDLYTDTPFMREMVLNGADEWLEALPYFTLAGEVNYEFVGFNVVLESPTLIGNHIEPPNGGLAFLFYSAYQLTHESKYLDGAKQVLDYLQTYSKNPNYEAMTDYAPFVAAALNAQYGTNYDVGKFLDFLFEKDSSFRPGWTVMSGQFANYPVHGLVGQQNDYAFAMNSFHLATVLAPLIKYDVRYANSIGKYLLNLVNNAKYFFPQKITLDHQSMDGYLPFDPYGSLLYEGLRNQYAGVNGYAMGDATTMFGQPSDLSIYSSAFTGALGALASPTNIDGILKIDLNATDSYGNRQFPNYLLYNPFNTMKIVEFIGPSVGFDLFDQVTQSIVARNVHGKVNVAVPAQGSKVLVVLPMNSELVENNRTISVQGHVIGKPQTAVNLLRLTSRQSLTSASDIEIETIVPSNDEVISMSIYFNEIKAYEGLPISKFRYDKAILPNTDYTLKVEITTKNGLVDYTTKRVVCY